jgi:predicted O-methyltransferase YrrM
MQSQTDFLKNLSIDSKYFFEIGFNGGHSAETILKNNSNCTVISCDIGWHFYTKYGNWYLKKKYGDRFKLYMGDSRDIVPRLEHEEYKFDLIFIDGGHEYKIALEDIIKCKKLANNKTILLLDDVLQDNEENVYHFNFGPTKAWNELISNNFISQLDYQEFKDENIFRSFVTGRYEISQ